jgi:glycerol-3-phosphate dehydrogenase (NAD(P)+)
VKFSVIGAGGWGTAFARLLALEGYETTLWVRNPAQKVEIARLGENRAYLPGVVLPEEHLHLTSSLEEAMRSEVVALAVPSFAMGTLLKQVQKNLSGAKTFINLAKGIDRTSGKTMSALIKDIVEPQDVFTLSGPSHAEEVGRDIPTAVVLAGTNLDLGKELQIAISTPRFRVYLSDDIHGVELCATVKNIIAIATGVSDGLGYGDNSRGALITRGLAEMVRFGRAFGVMEKTLFGLSGLGDLVATCTSSLSRNRGVGFRLAQGAPLSEILSGMKMVAEGVYATQIVHEMAREKEIDMPITEAVYLLLYEKADPLTLVDEIMTRSPKQETI